MLKFIRSKGNQQPSAERQKLQKELFAFRKVSQKIRESLKLPHRPVPSDKNSWNEKYLTRLHYKLFYLYMKHHISYQQKTPKKNKNFISSSLQLNASRCAWSSFFKVFILGWNKFQLS